MEIFPKPTMICVLFQSKCLLSWQKMMFSLRKTTTTFRLPELCFKNKRRMLAQFQLVTKIESSWYISDDEQEEKREITSQRKKRSKLGCTTGKEIAPLPLSAGLLHLQDFFFLERTGELRINILRRKKGVEAPGDTVMGLCHALTTDAYRLLQRD